MFIDHGQLFNCLRKKKIFFLHFLFTICNHHVLLHIICLFIYTSIKIAISTSFDLFPENGKYIYWLQSNLTLVPDLHSQENPQWNLKGLLEAERVDPNTLVLRVRL